VSPLLHKKEYGETPFAGVTKAVPSQDPIQLRVSPIVVEMTS